MEKTTTPYKLEYSNPFMDIRQVHADFGSFQKDYYVVDLGPRAGVVVLKGDLVLMTKQYRFLTDDFSWEIPGGRVDAGEEAEDAAIRECHEETGVRCTSLKPLVEYYPGLDNFDNRTSLFWSEHVEVIRPFVANEAEVVEIRWIPLRTLFDMIFRGQILDSLTVTGLFAYYTKQSALSNTSVLNAR